MTTPTPELLEGAEPLSHQGGRHGALVLHGFTGTPATVRPVADEFVAAGWSVEMPRLPGHGTTLDDMAATDWDDWYGEVAAAHGRLAARVDTVAVFGLSMGATLACRLAVDVGGFASLVVTNPAVQPPDPVLVQMAEQAIADGIHVLPGVASDISKPDVTELAYRDTPIGPALSLFAAQGELEPRLGEIDCPVLILTSENDHVVDPAASDLLAERVSGPVTRVMLERSFHVATLDWDADIVRTETLAFATRHAET